MANYSTFKIKWNPKVSVGGKSYDVYRVGNQYYYDTGTTTVPIASKYNEKLSKNEKVSLILDAPKAQTTSPTPSVSYSGGGGSASNNTAGYDKIIASLQDEISALQTPKKYTADDLAKLYGVEDQYDYNKILDMYNNATNTYYDSAEKTQAGINADANMSNAAYANNLIQRYLSGYNNAAPTAVGKGVIGANALSSLFGADETAGATATSLNDLINSYGEARKAELSNNPVTARTQYNTVGEWLLGKGAALNTADVQQYVDNLNSVATKYAANRNAQVTEANAATTAYQNNAQAALANNTANNAVKDLKYFKYWYGDNYAKAYSNYLNDVNTTNVYSSTK